MLQLTLLEKIKILFDLILASPFFIFMFIFTLLLLVVLLDIKSYDRKKVKKYILLIYIIVFLGVVIKYNSSFLSTLDYLIDNIFVVFYFPNIAVYALTIIISNIIMLLSLFKSSNRFTRNLNITMYSLIMYLMLLIIYMINQEGLNVYDQTSLYTNQNVLSLVELSNILCLVWLLVYLINKILDLLENKGIKIKSKIVPIKTNQQPKIITKYIEKEVIKEVPVEKIIYRDKQEDIFTKEEYMIMLNILKNRNK